MYIIPADSFQEKCQLWQQRLRLADWDIKFEIVPLRDMGGTQCGMISWNLEHRIADIKVIHPDDYRKDARRPYDMEETLVHELLHIWVAPFDAEEGTPEQLAQEQAINAIAAALIKLARAANV